MTPLNAAVSAASSAGDEARHPGRRAAGGHAAERLDLRDQLVADPLLRLADDRLVFAGDVDAIVDVLGTRVSGRLPLIGRVAAGRPILAEDNIEARYQSFNTPVGSLYVNGALGEKAKAFLATSGLDADRIAAEVGDRVGAAFVRATKPQQLTERAAAVGGVAAP